MAEMDLPLDEPGPIRIRRGVALGMLAAVALIALLAIAATAGALVLILGFLVG